MPSIDERVVSMAFENQVFEQRVAQTMTTLGKLDASIKKIGESNGLQDIEKAANKVTLQQPMSALEKLKARFSRAGDGAAQGMGDLERAGNKVQLEQPIRALNKVQAETAQVGRGAAAGFNEIERAAGKVSLAGVTQAIDTVNAKFSTMQAAASVAFGNVASQAAMKGANFAKSFSFAPIQQGFEEYQTNLGSIQTIMANTEGQRISGLGATNAALNDLNHYSDQTIYNFSQMARNIGTFTAAGVDLKTSTASIKGIANLAALSGSNSQQASTAMYQLSQAIASGKVGLQDWNSVVNAGMGGRKFQNSLIQTAIAMGKIPEEAVKIDKATGKATINGESFRESIMAKPGQESWLSSDVLTTSLESFTGDMSDAELKARGFSDAQIKSIQATAKTAKDAATQVKTLPQVFDVAKEAIGSGWAQTFQMIFGNFTEAKKLWTSVSQSINGIINQNATARNKILAAWKKGGGRADLIEGIKNALHALMTIVHVVGQAFRQIFPKKTAGDLIEMTRNFKELTAKLQPTYGTIQGLRRTFAGFFAVLHIGWSVIKGVVGVIGDLLGVVGSGSGGFLNFTGSIGDFLVAVDNALTKGGLLTSFFDGLSAVLQAPVKLFTQLGSAIFGLFSAGDGGGADKVAGGLTKVKDAATPLENVMNGLKRAWDKLVNIFRQAKELVSPWLDKIGEELGHLTETIGKAFEGGNFDHVMTVLQTGFIGGIFLAIKKAIKGGSGELTGILGGLKDVMGGLTGQLTAMQQKVKADTLFKIAGSIGILAASTALLATINAADLTRALSAMAVGFGQLVAAMKLMTSGLGKTGFAQLPFIAVALMGMATAMVILGGAMKIFATMDWEELAKGLVGVGGGIAAMAVGMKTMGGGAMMIAQGAALILVGIGLNAVAAAVKQFASISWEDLGRGVAGVLASLIAIGAPMSAAGPELLIGAAAIVPIAFGMTMLAQAIKSFGGMDWEELYRGIGGAASALIALGIALSAMPPTAILAAGGLVVASIGLTALAGAVKAFGSMDVSTLAKGIVAMGGALVTLALGLTAMVASLPGAVALTLAAFALGLLGPTIAFMGTLDWGTILKGLGALALVLGTLSIVGVAAGPGLIALGAALLPLGIAFLAAGTAAYLFGAGMQKLGAEGTKGVGIMIAAITAFIAVLPKIIIDFVKGLVGILAEIAKIAPQVVDSLVKILNSLIEVVIKSTPRLALAIGTLVDGILQVIIRDSPKLIQAGVTLMINLLKGLDSYIPQMIPRVASIVSRFLLGLAAKAPMLTAAGAKFIISFLNGITSHVGDIVAAAGRLVLGFYNAAIKIIPKLAALGPRALAGFVRGLTSGIGDLINAGARLVTRTLNGVSSKFDDVARTATRFVVRFFEAFGNRKNVARMVDGGIKAAIHVMQGISDGIKKDENLKKVIEAAEDIGLAIVEGVVKGLASLPEKLGKKLLGPVKSGVDDVKGFLHIGSPSKLFHKIGEFVVDGFGGGLGGLRKMFASKLLAPVKDAAAGAKKVLKSKSPSQVFVEIGEAINDGLGIGLRGVAGTLEGGVAQPIAAMLTRTKGLREFKKFLNTEFRDGLFGGLFTSDKRTEVQKQIDGAFDALKTKLTENHKVLRDKIKEEQDKLDELMKDPKKNGAAIDRVRATIAEDQKTLALSQFRSRSLMRQYEDEKAALAVLAVQYEEVGKQIEKAQAIFDEYRQQYNQLPDISGIVDDALAKMKEADDLAAMSGADRWKAERERQKEEARKASIDQVAIYKQSLADQIAATQKYMETLTKLRDAGLDDATFEKLLKQGTSGQAFASQLLAKGKAGIDEINKLDAELAKTAVSIADKAAKELYQAGLDAASGFIEGLKAKQAEIQKMMEAMAASIINPLKFRLGIRSPSRVFAEMGAFSVQGLINGLKSSTGAVGQAAADLGDEASKALSRSLADIQNGVDSDLTITPVLDLTQIEKDAGKIQDLTNVTPITAAASYGQATAISDATQAATADAVDDGPTVVEFNFEQTNTSPEALNDVEIYRKTNNQLSQVKSALGLLR